VSTKRVAIIVSMMKALNLGATISIVRSFDIILFLTKLRVPVSDRSGPPDEEDEEDDRDGENAAFDVAEIRGSLTIAEEELMAGELEEDVELELEGDFA
jgi:hypothetical protein